MPQQGRGILRHLDRWRQVLLPAGEAAEWGGLEPALAGTAGSPDRPAATRTCVFCGATRHVIPHRGKGICVECVAEIRRLVSPGAEPEDAQP